MNCASGKAKEGEPFMKLWKLALGVTVVGAVVLVLAGRDDIARFRRMKNM
jgi:hypothetical protein